MTRPHLGLLAMIVGLGVATAAAFVRTRTEVLSTRADLDEHESSSTSTVRAEWPVGLLDLSVQNVSGPQEDPQAFRDRVKADFAFYLDHFPPEKRP